MKEILLFLSLALLTTTYVFAQEDSFKEVESEEHFKHQVGFLLGHSHVPSLYSDGKKEWKALPSFTLYYNYWLNDKWAVGLHTDVIIENFVVEENFASEGEATFLEREKPVAPAVMVVFKPGEHFSYLLGAGGEFAKGENLFLIRTEVAYAIEMPKAWEFEVSLGHDLRWDAYNTINLGLGISKSF
ncbi:hypothetical protein [Aestuariibaculum suncheonense]|uniref:Lipid A 3-O-deacylase PagL n=1 Tax=Aestuariibaculum suncheonense TaxID=1028745 RepID=A0A8J6QAX0_9FLAO|nr:hypothetical protein [Aestuariibaculum suncheonense]MBD0834380.1 hypothetical protein [Aestuariibaculum suncheonense]